MRALIDEQQRIKRRRRRIQLSIGFSILLVLLYLAVTTFIFNPIEPGAIAFQNAVPNNCEFFIRKVDLAADFPLPSTVLTPGAEEAVLWKAFEDGKFGVPSATVKSWTSEYDAFVKSLAGTPIDPLRDLLGKEVCVAGRFSDKGGLAATRYCIYLRVGWRIRAMMGAARYEWIRNKFLPKDVKVEILASGIWRVSPAGEKDLYVYRNSDLVMIASDEDWIKDANNLLIDRERNFGLTSIFAEDIRQPIEQRAAGRPLPSNLQIYVNLDEYRKAAGKSGKWFDASSTLWDERLLATTFHPEFIKDIAGSIRFEKTPRRRIALELTCRTDGEKLDPFARKILQDKWSQQLSAGDLRLVGEMIPQAAFAGGAVAVSGGDIARHLETLLVVEDRRVADESVKRSGRFDNLKQFADEIGGSLGDRAILALRENNYAHEEKDPIETGPEPAWAAVFPQRDPSKIRAMMDYVKNSKANFGISDVFTWKIDRVYELVEYYNNFIAGNGEIAVLPIGADTGGNFIISNQAKLIRNIHRMWAGGSQEEDKPYGIDYWYRDLLEEQKGKRMNAVLFASGPKTAKALKKCTDVWLVESAGMTPEEMTAERPRLFDRLLKEKYPNYKKDAVPENVKSEIDGLVDQEFARRQDSAKANVSTAKKQHYDELLRWVAAVPGIAGTLELELKRARVYVNLLLE